MYGIVIVWEITLLRIMEFDWKEALEDDERFKRVDDASRRILALLNGYPLMAEEEEANEQTEQETNHDDGMDMEVDSEREEDVTMDTNDEDTERKEEEEIDFINPMEDLSDFEKEETKTQEIVQENTTNGHTQKGKDDVDMDASVGEEDPDEVKYE